MSGTVGGLSLTNSEYQTLNGILCAICPGDDQQPDGITAGGVDFLARITDARPEWLGQLRRVLAQYSDIVTGGLSTSALQAALTDTVSHPELARLSALVQDGIYADPETGAHPTGILWKALDWDPAPLAG